MPESGRMIRSVPVKESCRNRTVPGWVLARARFEEAPDVAAVLEDVVVAGWGHIRPREE